MEITLEDIKKMKVAELKTELQNRNLPFTGNKAELQARLEDWIASSAKPTTPASHSKPTTPSVSSSAPTAAQSRPGSVLGDSSKLFSSGLWCLLNILMLVVEAPLALPQ